MLSIKEIEQVEVSLDCLVDIYKVANSDEEALVRVEAIKILLNKLANKIGELDE